MVKGGMTPSKTNSHFISRSRTLLPGEVKAQGESRHRILVLTGWLQGQQRLFLHNEPRGEDKGQHVQVVPQEVSSQHRKVFTVTTTILWNNLRSDMAESPLPEVFKM